MLRRTALAALVVLLAVSSAKAAATRTVTQEIPVATPFAVENLLGAYRVIPGDGGSVVATVTIHAESEELADAVRFERVSDGGTRSVYRVRYPYERVKTFRMPGGSASGDKSKTWFGGMFGGSSNTTTTYDHRHVKVSSSTGTLLYADVEVRVPRREVDGVFRNVAGSLSGSRLYGSALTFDTGSGDIHIEDVEAKVGADTGSGDIHASRIRGAFTADTGSGDIHLEEFEGETVSCDVGSGDVRLKTLRAKKVDCDTGSGDIEASELTVEVFDADTGSGNIVLKTEGNVVSKISADTGSGDVTLRLGPDASFEATASQGSGDILSGFGDAQPILKGKELVGYRRGDGRIKITVDTGSGDLVIEPGS